MEFISGKITECTMGNGTITIWRDMEFTCGVTAGGMKANITMIKNVDMVFTTGLMGEGTRGGGIRVSSMG